MGAVFTIVGYMLFAAATFTGAVLAHADWAQYTASREAGHVDKKARKFAQAP